MLSTKPKNFSKPGLMVDQLKLFIESGWVDTATFVDFFEKAVFPWTDGLQDPKGVIRGKVCTHFSLEVIKKCQEKQIRFVRMPPNSTHLLLEPLYFSMFCSIEYFWKETLSQWQAGAGKGGGVLPKEQFARLLRGTLDKAAPTFTANSKTGFGTCDICPVSADPINENVAAAIEEMLKPKEKPAGRAIQTEDLTK